MVWSESRKTWGQMQSDPYIKEKTICRGARCCRQCNLKTAFHLIHFHSILGPSINSVVKQLWKLLSRPRQCLEDVGGKKQVQLSETLQPHGSPWQSTCWAENVVQTFKKNNNLNLEKVCFGVKIETYFSGHRCGRFEMTACDCHWNKSCLAESQHSTRHHTCLDRH